jgi:hypothetical protein
MKREKAVTECGEVYRNSMPTNGGLTPGRTKKACWPVGEGRRREKAVTKPDEVYRNLCQHTNEAYQKVTQTNMGDEFERKNLDNQLVSSMEERET